MGRAKECIKEQEEGKMSEHEVQAVVNKADIITYGTMAQMSHFQAERVQDYKAMMQKYLREQISFYKNVRICCRFVSLFDWEGLVVRLYFH